MIEKIKKAINNNAPLENIKRGVKELLLAEHKAEWDKANREEYDSLYPIYRQYTEEEYQAYLDGLEDGHTVLPIESLDVEIDYSEDENYLSYNEWINETKVITEAVEATYDEDGMELTPAEPEVTEQVRPYIQLDIDDDMIGSKLLELGYDYKKKRELEYPSIEEQLDILYHEGYEGWANMIQAIKDKYPKE
jgi:hypothetical protein